VVEAETGRAPEWAPAPAAEPAAATEGDAGEAAGDDDAPAAD